MAASAPISNVFQAMDKAGYKDVLALIGLLCAAKVSLTLVVNLLRAVRVYILTQLPRRQPNLAIKYGAKWAAVTGASDGIGKAFAYELGKCGMNVILMSRSTEKLQKVAALIERDFKVQTHIIPVDFSSQDVYPRISKALLEFDIGILVNNVGVMYEYPQYFLDVPDKKLYDLINVNMTSVIMMSRLILPQMCRRKRGAVINMSSSAGQLPTPQMTVYAASKEFIDSFSRALAYEYSADGIEIQSLRPAYVATAMTYGTKPSLVVPSPETYVKSALQTLGVSRRNTGYWSHALQGWLLGFCPEWLWMWGASLLNNQIRKTVLRNK